MYFFFFFFFSSRRRHTSFSRDWSSDVCSSDLHNLNNPIVFVIIEGRGLSSSSARNDAIDRKSGVEGKSVDLGGGRIIKKKRKNKKINSIIVVQPRPNNNDQTLYN